MPVHVGLICAFNYTKKYNNSANKNPNSFSLKSVFKFEVILDFLLISFILISHAICYVVIIRVATLTRLFTIPLSKSSQKAWAKLKFR